MICQILGRVLPTVLVGREANSPARSTHVHFEYAVDGLDWLVMRQSVRIRKWQFVFVAMMESLVSL